jgi:hypothetical protein
MESPNILKQSVISIVSLGVVFFILAALEYFYKIYYSMSSTKVEILKDTSVSSNPMIIVTQNPSLTTSKTILASDNEFSGIEFSYSFFLNIGSDTFNNNSTQLKHVFHKGYAMPYPLLSPGVFILNSENTMRIFMSSFNNWANYVDIQNIPVDKWFHTALVYKKAGLEVYINGNLFKKIPFLNGDLPYQNFENVYIFNRFNGTLPVTVPAVKNFTDSTSSAHDPNFYTSFGGQMTGSLSRLNYFRYALGFSDIQSLMNEGPSKKIQGQPGNNRVTPYLQDTWWTTTYS